MSVIKRLSGNFFALTFMQLSNFLLPLLTYPYLGVVLGAERFGLIMLAQSFIQYFVLITDFGFNLSATRKISINRDDAVKVNEIFSAVFIIKLCLLFISFISMVVIVFLVSRFKEFWYIYILNFGVVIGNTLFPSWFFQGMEKMKYTTILNVTSKILFTIFIFLFVKNKSDVYLVPLLNSLGFLIAGTIGFTTAIKKFSIRLIIPSKGLLIDQLKESAQYFLSRISVSAYTVTNTVLIGLLLGNKMAGYFAVAEKIANILSVGISTIVDAIYPYMSRNRDIRTFKKIFMFVMVASTVGCIVIFIISDQIIILLFGKEFLLSSNIFKIMIVATYISIPSMLIGYPLLAAFGYANYANYSVLIASILHIIAVIIIIPFANIYIITSVLIVTQLIVLGIRVYGMKTKLGLSLKENV
ncbi:oligosaccharide flippase family protein [Geobacillus thermodenitrificans]|jgi:polysaccharide transporter, PST family|uniref:Possible O-antigen/teichoic acid transporter n=1 Tax=Geobacillus thermodenitrificans (strain NG80-2) TaxID=420246 RepID=A4ITE6_GEOTN|nr:oligosaccharide flippase family protein [Geobacillus thermodenitrificans]ABO68600.1 Possible O-antigen/teichoic acid transporter [Geobacillus thermodenitrificans NG80-2]